MTKTFTLRVRVEYEASIEIDAESEEAAKSAFEGGDYDGNSLELAEMVNWEVRSIKEIDSDPDILRDDRDERRRLEREHPSDV